MPWCDACDRFLSPNTVHGDGTCPSCGAKIASPTSLRRAKRGRGSSADAMAVRAEQEGSAHVQSESGSDDPSADGNEDRIKAPWHFKLLVVALVIYLGYRLIQGILLVGHWL